MTGSGITVVKIGGNEIDSADWVKHLAGLIGSFSGRVVLVHGGGKEVSELQRALGAEPEWREGLRVTTPEALRAVCMVLSGVVNKRLTGALLDAGVEAAGVCGEDAALLVAEPVQGGRMGRTGAIVEVRPRLVHVLLEAGLVPVVSPVSRGTDGAPLNVNADDAAAALAGALEAEQLLFVSNVPGVLKEGAVLPEVTVAAVETLIAEGTAAGGMAPKLRAAARAAERGEGVGEVRIGGLEMLLNRRVGTRISASRPAVVSS